MMRVVHANFLRPLHHSDPGRLLEEWPTLIDVAAAVAATGVEVTLIQSFGRDALVHQRGVCCRFVREFALPGYASGLQPFRLAREAKGVGADVIHVNGLDFPGHTRAMSATGLPVLVQDHASRPGGRKRLRRWGLAGIAGIAFTDAAQAQPFVAEGSLRPDVPVFSVPESSTHFSPGDQDEARAATGIFGDPAVLWVGRLDTNKDPLTILDAVEIAANDLPDLHLWCCYHEQPLMNEVRARIVGSRALAERVHLLGRVEHEQIERLCRAADRFMVASHHEGSGYALIEALACGLTPVVSDIPSFRRLAGDAGVLAPVEDARSFATGLIALQREPREALRRKATGHFQANLSFEAVGQRLREAYSALLPAAA